MDGSITGWVLQVPSLSGTEEQEDGKAMCGTLENSENMLCSCDGGGGIDRSNL